MSYLVNLALEERLALVVGGGEVAVRKIEDLLAAGASVNVVAIEPCAAARSLAESGRIAALWREYRRTDLDGAFVVVAATRDKEVNARVSRDAQSLGVLVNVVDEPALCSFTVPATLRRGPLTLAVATDGSCPAFAGVLREDLGERYGPEYGELTRVMGELRRRMIAQGWDGRRIRDAVRALYHDGIREAVASGDRNRVDALVQACLAGR